MEEYNKGKYDAFKEIYQWLHYDYKYGRKSKDQIVEDVKRKCFTEGEKLDINE